MIASTLVALSLSAFASANIFVTSPVASTTFNGGQQATISWQDDGAAPSLAQFGNSHVSIYTGNSQQQTLLQYIVDVDVSQKSSILFTPNPSIGPNQDEYFVRFESVALKDATSPQYPALAFSAKFTMASMTGTFNQSVQAQIDGQSTAPIGGTAAPAAPASTAPAAVTSSPSSTGMKTATNPASTSKAASNSSKNTTSSAFKTFGVSGSAMLGLGAMAAVVLY